MDEPLAVYVHWPFCESKCPYCDFNSHVAENIDHDRWRAAYLREIDRYAEETQGRTVTSVFFGGGTPSLMPPATVAAILERIAARWTLAGDVEVTAEANPSSAEAAVFADFRAAGINRVSIGVQSLDDAVLKFLGRRHDAAEARAAVAIAAKTFPRYSLDLMTARAGQTDAAWRAELTSALDLAGEHISVYQLTIEPGTGFHRDRVATADDDTAAAIFETTEDVLAAEGFAAYEISNFAKPGAECRHNLTYWRGEDYLGVGPGAHGRITDRGSTDAVQEIRLPGEWLAAAEAGNATHRRKPVASADRCREVLLMGLRLTEGVSADRFKRLTGTELTDALDPDGLEALTRGGLVLYDETVLRVMPEARLRLDAVLTRLVA